MKKILALVMVVAMLACFATVANAAAPEGQIAYYTFDAADEAGLTVNGDNATYADGAVTLGDATYLTADIDLSGVTAMTVALKVKITDTDANWGFEITSEEAHSWPAEHYIGCLLNGSAVIERYNNTDGRPNSASATIAVDEWVELVVVLPEDGSIVLYADGAEVANVPQTEGFDLAIANCIGETPVFQIGKANWGEGEYAAGTSIDTFAVYNTALSADEVATALEAPAADEEAAQTGFATVALAIVAIGSGAYIVSKKH